MKKGKSFAGILAAGIIGVGSVFSGVAVTGIVQQTEVEAATMFSDWYGTSHVQFHDTSGKPIEKEFSYKVKILKMDSQIAVGSKGDAGISMLNRGYSPYTPNGVSDGIQHFTIKTEYLIYDFEVPAGYEKPGEIKFKIDDNKNVIILNDEGKDVLSVKKSSFASDFRYIYPNNKRDTNGFYIKIYKKGEAKNGWKKENGKYRYYKNNVAYTGWHYMTSKEGEKTPHWSYFGKDGYIYTGWKYMSKTEGETTPHYSYFGSNGWLRTGWVKFGKGTSEPDNNSAVHYSYFGDNGWLRTGWQTMGKGTKNPDGNSAKHMSFFGSNGWLRTGWVWMDKSQGEKTPHFSYFGGNGWLRTGIVTLGKADGEKVTHKSYFGTNGWLVTNRRFSVAGKAYTADSRGWLK